MSLYDDIEMEKAAASGWASSIKLMPSQMAFKKASFAGTRRDQRRGNTKLAPVINLKSRRDDDESSSPPMPSATTVTTQLLLAAAGRGPLPHTDPPLGVGSGVSGSIGPLDPEWKFTNEYHPLWPNDYEKVVREMRERRDKEEAEKRQQEREERERKWRGLLIVSWGRVVKAPDRELGCCGAGSVSYTHLRISGGSGGGDVSTSASTAAGVSSDLLKNPSKVAVLRVSILVSWHQGQYPGTRVSILTPGSVSWHQDQYHGTKASILAPGQYPGILAPGQVSILAPGSVSWYQGQYPDTRVCILVPGSVSWHQGQYPGTREGQGLGKSEQGIVRALEVEKTSKRGGRIVAEEGGPPPPSPPHSDGLPIMGAPETVIDLNGRFFGGRQVAAGFYDHDNFKAFKLNEPIT
ncbi:splicing factor 45 [Hyalella azteca]|uniref:Splicing factor 45 n=1 Tax=Hyalella azteca TaxID=294128 RepID=A0A8B7NGV6_HYAAZ|nr:splicing factor 45 [Hyalella azteca]